MRQARSLETQDYYICRKEMTTRPNATPTPPMPDNYGVPHGRVSKEASSRNSAENTTFAATDELCGRRKQLRTPVIDFAEPKRKARVSLRAQARA